MDSTNIDGGAVFNQRAFRLGGLTVEPTRNIFKVQGQIISIEPMIMEVLCVLVRHSRDVVTRDHLVRQVWGVQYGADESLTRAISILRKTFREAGEPDGYIETIPKSGYRLRQNPQVLDVQTAELKGVESKIDGIGDTPRSGSQSPKDVLSATSRADTPGIAALADNFANASDTGAGPKNTRPPLSFNVIVLLMAGVVILGGLFVFLSNASTKISFQALPGQTRSVAVLSFADMSANKDQEYFSDGMAEEILNALMTLPNIRVAGRTSSFVFKGQNVDMREIGKSLSVSHIIDGSVRKQGDDLRVTVHLINSRDGLSMWSKSYDGTLSDFLELQKRISRDIVFELKIVFSVGIEKVIDLDPISPATPIVENK